MWIRQSISNMFRGSLVFIQAQNFLANFKVFKYLPVLQWYQRKKADQYKHHVNESLPLRLLLWMFCKCFTVISRISAFSSLDCCWETGSDEKLVQSVDMWRWDTWSDTHIQPEGSDHSFLKLIQTVVYSLPPFPLDEWFPHLWGEKNNNKVKAMRRRTTRRGLIQTHRSVFIYPKLNYLSLFFSTGVFAWVVRHIWSSHVSNWLSALLRPLLRISARL